MFWTTPFTNGAIRCKWFENAFVHHYTVQTIVMFVHCLHNKKLHKTTWTLLYTCGMEWGAIDEGDKSPAMPFFPSYSISTVNTLQSATWLPLLWNLTQSYHLSTKGRTQKAISAKEPLGLSHPFNYSANDYHYKQCTVKGVECVLGNGSRAV